MAPPSPERNDPAVLANLLGRSDAAPPVAHMRPAGQNLEASARPAAQSSAERPVRTTKAKTSWQDIPFYGAALALGLFLWIVGGYFTLDALRAFGLPVVAVITWPWEMTLIGQLSWCIPLAISALEIGFSRRRGLALLVFVVVGGFDWFTTTFGLHVWADGRVLFGLTLTASASMTIAVGLIAAGFTFLPERIVARSVRELWIFAITLWTVVK